MNASPLVELHTRLFRNCLDGTAAVLWRRPAAEVNALGFLAVHLIDSRHYIVGLLGGEVEHPFGQSIEDARSMDDFTVHPGLDELLPAWEQVSAALAAAVGEVAEERWRADAEARFPIGDPTLRGGLDFLLHHEAYHIGQMAILRRCFGLPAMSYAAGDGGGEGG